MEDKGRFIKGYVCRLVSLSAPCLWVLRMFISSWHHGNYCPAFRQEGVVECGQRRGNSADFGGTTMKKDSEASVALRGRWRVCEEEGKRASGHILGTAGNPGQAPASRKDLALKKRRWIRNFYL